MGRDAAPQDRRGPLRQLEGDPVLEYQPAVDLHTGVLLGFEALLRWDHPTRGALAPGVLVQWAEANDCILELDAWALNEACVEAAHWPSGIQVAVDCSVTLLRRQRASAAVQAALERAALPPDRLTVEVTEAAVTDERAGAELRALDRAGVRLAVDDVGTSWTSLENLRRFAIETAKIDRRFIAELEPGEGMNRAIVEAIVQVSKSLAMSTVADGVDSADQVRALRAMGVDVAQGTFFAAPMGSEPARALASTAPRQVFELGTGSDQDRDAAGLARLPLVVLSGAHGEERPVAGGERGPVAAQGS